MNDKTVKYLVVIEDVDISNFGSDPKRFPAAERMMLRITADEADSCLRALFYLKFAKIHALSIEPWTQDHSIDVQNWAYFVGQRYYGYARYRQATLIGEIPPASQDFIFSSDLNICNNLLDKYRRLVLFSDGLGG